MVIVRNHTGQFSKSSVDSRKQKARERASKLNQKPVVACDQAKVENKVDKFQGCRIIDLKLFDIPARKWMQSVWRSAPSSKPGR